ncbi:MAG: hypothetical protein VCD31_17680, partial [Alphaproteobacteria bacterium]
MRGKMFGGISSTFAVKINFARSFSSMRPANTLSSTASSHYSTLIRSGGVTFGPGVSSDITISPDISDLNDITTSLMADGQTLTPRRISMSSVQPTHLSRVPVRPHAHALVFIT